MTSYKYNSTVLPAPQRPVRTCSVMASLVAFMSLCTLGEPNKSSIRTIPKSDRLSFADVFPGVGAPTSGSMRCQAKGTAGIKMGRDVSCSDDFVGGHACTIDCCSPDDEKKHFNSSSVNSFATTEQQTMLFLLGFPYTGTSAVHFMVATGHGVGSLGKPDIMGPRKEGWRQVLYKGQKLMTQLKRANDGVPTLTYPDDYIPWELLVEKYHKLWDSKKPILLENSPPEIMHARKIKEMFGKRNPERVKFLLFAKQPCNSVPLQPRGNPKKDGPQFFGRLALMKQIVKEFGKDVFLLRYEDLCVRPKQTAAALERWLPKIGNLNVNARSKKTKRRTHIDSHHEDSLTIPEYCTQIALPSWPIASNIHISKADGVAGHYLKDESSINNLMNFFGYTPIFNETK